MFLVSVLVKAQEIRVTPEASKDLNYFVNSIRGIESFNADYIAIKLIESGRTIGSYPELEGIDVVLFDFHISIKERIDDDAPTTTGNYWVDGNFHNPRSYKFDPVTKTLTFQHGTDKNPKSTSLQISSAGIKVK